MGEEKSDSAFRTISEVADALECEATCAALLGEQI